jgi:acetoacetyl-CoA synthetase
MASNGDINGTLTSNGVGHVSPQKLWEHPNPTGTPMYKFVQDLNKKYDLSLRGYDELHKWSIDNIAKFWEEVWHSTGIKASKPFDRVTQSMLIQARTS